MSCLEGKAPRAAHRIAAIAKRLTNGGHSDGETKAHATRLREAVVLPQVPIRSALERASIIPQPDFRA